MHCLRVFSALLGLCAAGQVFAGSILFIGNSFTFAYGSPVRYYRPDSVTDLNSTHQGGVPALFKSFTVEAGLSYQVYLETEPGVGVDWHLQHKLAVIGEKPWDNVVMHGYSTLDAKKPGDPGLLIASLHQMTGFLRSKNPNVDIRIMATWPRADETYGINGAWHGKPIEGMARDVRDGYDKAAAASPAIKGVIPVGDAWIRAMHSGVADSNPYDGIDQGRLDLWAADNYHASTHGSYLEALVIFGSVTGRDPQSLGSGECSGFELGLSAAEVSALEKVASDELAAEGMIQAPRPAAGNASPPAKCAASTPPSDARTAPRPYLNMPQLADGKLPQLLSQTGAFSDVMRHQTEKGLIPYDLIVAFWSDGARKSRWAAIPGKVEFSPTGEWKFPNGSVFVKTFFLPTDAAHPEQQRRLETRLLVRDSAGAVYGVTYKWRADGSDADLLPGALSENITVRAIDGTTHQQTWYYPSRQDCSTCHTARAGYVLGLNTRQMNHDFAYPSGASNNELREWNRLGLFAPALTQQELSALPALAAPDDASRSLEDRARSYLDANCSHCHRPGGTVANFDARYETPLADQGLIDGPVLIDQGIDRPRVISPHDIWRSIMFMRVNTVGDIKMPPLARETIDTGGVNLLRQWIESLPGRPVLPPPVITPDGGSFGGPTEVTLSTDEAGAQIRYTLDGSTPGPSDPLYQGPITLTAPTVLRARAYKDGFTRSITNQQVFVVGN